MSDFVSDLGSSFAWLGVALGLMVAGFAVLDVLTPGNLRKQVSNSLNAAVLVAGKLIAVAVIVFAAIWTAGDDLDDGLVDALLYSALGLLVSAVALWLLDLALPAKLRNLVNEQEFNPAAIVAVGAELGVALVVAAAIS